MSNASCAQYGCPTPTPTWPVVTVTPGPQPPLPYTGWDVGYVAALGGMILLLGLAIALAIHVRWSTRH